MKHNRRLFIAQSSLGALGLLPISNVLGNNTASTFGYDFESVPQEKTPIGPLYPSTKGEEISAVVGASHAKFDVVKELVSARPELAKATWDWGFGDVESALGAAAHMGRKDIAEFLIEKGARPDIYTFAMLGKRNTVEAMIKDLPGIQKINGPHGFTLLHHAQIRLLRKNVEGDEKGKQEELVEYLESLGDANIPQYRKEMTEAEQEVYLGKYVFGSGENDYFEVKKNMQGLLAMARGPYFGRSLHLQEGQIFAPGGAPSVRIHFEVKEGKATSVTVHDPMPIVKATRA